MDKVGILSLGCPRNLLDSEVIAGSLKKAGFKIGDVEKGVDTCIINTCAFIRSAREESIDAILDAAGLKREGRIKRLVVCGCLAQMDKGSLNRKIPEIDILVGTNDFTKLPGLLKISGLKKRTSLVGKRLDYLYDESSPRSLLTPPHYAYVKISEGCSNLCSYCIISALRGKFRSRTIDSVVAEARKISASGVLKEINLIGQDTTLFGADRYGRPKLAELLKKLSAIKSNVRWLRILYTHPAHYNDELIETIREEDKVCKYLDLPIQHISDRILKRMNRKTTRKSIEELINKLRRRIPDLTLRTSVIVGFPGETEKDFNELLKFMKKAEFDRLGAFVYSKEKGTRAAHLTGEVPEDIKKERFDEVMKLQQSISAKNNKRFLGKTLEVLIDEKTGDSKTEYIGRTEGDAPEIDGNMYVTGKNIKIGEFYRVKITDTMEYDLAGKKVGA